MLPNPHETADLVTFTEEILNGKLHLKIIKNHNKIIAASDKNDLNLKKHSLANDNICLANENVFSQF